MTASVVFDGYNHRTRRAQVGFELLAQVNQPFSFALMLVRASWRTAIGFWVEGGQSVTPVSHFWLCDWVPTEPRPTEPPAARSHRFMETNDARHAEYVQV